MATKTNIIEIFQRFQRHNPNPTTELAYTNTYTLLVAVVLSAQATDKGVNQATKGLFEVADSPEKMLALGEDGLKKHIKTIGLFNTKAKNVMALSQMLLDRHNGQVPTTREELEALPGVGRKTANVILNTAFGQSTLAVDTHVFRVSKRLGLADAATPEKVEQQLYQVIPAEFLYDAHHWLILHGRYICTAQKPKCATCFLQDLCPAAKTFLS
ncbi:MAG: endonuclease III [Holosporales bacterium]